MDKNHKRILRNTGMLYIRMLLAMAVGLYTSRVVLDVLGVEDFGIYHVVAGFVALLGFMQGAMTTATQRYFAFDLGQNNGSNLCILFNTSLQVHALLAFGIVLLAETLGYWFVSTHLTIPPDRMAAALLTYHLSVAAFVISVMTVPLTAILMANERMGLFALMSMIDVLLKLLAVLLLPYLTSDQLSMYAALLLGVALITFVGYSAINRTVFPAVRLQWAWNAEGFRSMMGFAAWNTWGNLAAAMSEHGNNILLNIFFGPAVNAGRSIASQANGALNNFVVNVQAAVNPQIVKQFASGQQQQMDALVQKASKYNFLLLLVLTMPVFFYTEKLLVLWLVTPPDYVVVFLQLTMVISLIDSISRPLMTAVQATGKIRLYQTLIGSILLLNVPISYAALEVWKRPSVVIWSGIVVALLALLARLLIMRKLIGIDVADYIKNVIFRIVIVSFFVVVVNIFTVVQGSGILMLAMGLLVSFISTAVFIYLFGLASNEKRFLLVYIARLYRKIS